MKSHQDCTLNRLPHSPLGLVLSGGGARGTFQVGVYETLLSDPRGMRGPPDVVSGTSAGALNAALIAAGLGPRQLLDFWLDLAHEPPVVANPQLFRALRNALAGLAGREPIRPLNRRRREFRLLRQLLAKHRWLLPSGAIAMLVEFLMTARFDNVSYLLARIDTPYVFDTGRLTERLERAVGAPEIRGSRIRLAINTVDVRTGGVVRIVNALPCKRKPGNSHYRFFPAIRMDMIAASAAIPLLFNPVEVDGSELWDGGLLVNTPLAPAVALGAKRLVPVLVTVENGHHGRLKTMGAAVERVADIFLENAYNIDRKLLLDRNMLAELLPELELTAVELFRPIRPDPGYIFDAGSYLYFEKQAMLAMYEAGKRAARHWLDRGLCLDERKEG